MAVPTDILELMQKLKNMTTDKGCTPAEAANAADRLHRLLQTHQLSIGDLNAKTIDEDVELLTLERPDGGKWGYGVREFANQIAYAFDCKLLADSRTLYFIGVESDVCVASFFFEQTHESVMTAGRIQGRTEGATGASLTHYVQNFVSGAGVAIANRLKAPTEGMVMTCERAGEVQACKALVPVKKQKVDDYVDRAFPNCTPRKARGYKDGASDGWEYGNNMDLQRGLDGARSQPKAALGGGA